MTIAFTLLASLIVALTVVPAMSSFTLRTTKDVKTPWFDKLSQGYGKFLEKCLSKRALVLIVTLVLLVVSVTLPAPPKVFEKFKLFVREVLELWT